MESGFVYIITNDRCTTLYIGCTNDLRKRIHHHRHRLIAGFSKKYNLQRLVYYEKLSSMSEARSRESALKGGSRQRKVTLIVAENPDWVDLYDELPSPSSQIK